MDWELLLTYSFKTLVRLFLYLTSLSWIRVAAFVTGQIAYEPLLGCSSVKLYYKFERNGKWIKGSDIIPQLTLPEAKEYAASFTHNSPRTIRVNPNNPEVTRYFERDQGG